LQPGDYILDVIDIPSPIAVVRGSINDEDLHLASSVLARYSDGKNSAVKVSYKILPSSDSKFLTASPAKEDLIISLRI